MDLFWEKFITFWNYSSSLWVQFMSSTPELQNLNRRLKIKVILQWLQTWIFTIWVFCELNCNFYFYHIFCLQRHLKAVRNKQYCNFCFLLLLNLNFWICQTHSYLLTFPIYLHFCFLMWKTIFENKVNKDCLGLTMSEDKLTYLVMLIYNLHEIIDKFID